MLDGTTIEIMVAANEADDGGDPGSYEEALNGPEKGGWKKAFDAEEASYLGELKWEIDGTRGGSRVKCIGLLTDSQSAKSPAGNPFHHGRS